MDFLNKEKLTHIIIFIFILLSLNYLYNMNSNQKNKSKTITENFMIITEDQDLQANDVLIDNLVQVVFQAGGNDNSTIKFSDPEREWPVTLQEIFDTKLDNSGIIGGPVPAGHTPLQGIILSNTDRISQPLVKIGANLGWAVPTSATLINDNFIQFGGSNKNRQINSARISINSRQYDNDDGIDSLCIVGMSNESGDVSTRQIKMWAEGGLTLVNSTPLYVTGSLDVTEETYIESTLEVTGGSYLGALDVNEASVLRSTLEVIGVSNLGELDVTGATTLNSTLYVTGGTDLRSTLNVNGATTLKSSLTVTGVTDLKSTLNVGTILTVTGETELKSKLDVTGVTDLKNILSVTGGTALKSTLDVTGASTLSSLTLTGALSLSTLGVSSTLNVTGGTILKNTLNVTGATDLKNRLGVDGATVLKDTLNVTGETKLNSLIVTGATALSSLGVTGLSTLAGLSVTSLTVNGVGMLGIGQTWQTFTPVQRAKIVKHSNNTNKPIQVNITIDVSNEGVAYLYIDDVIIAQTNMVVSASVDVSQHTGETVSVYVTCRNTLSAIVPNGSKYRLETTGEATVNSWCELR
jgi:hypothetical protein